MLARRVPVLFVIVAACGASPPPAPKTATPAAEAPPQAGPEDEALLAAAKRICRLVEHNDQGVVAVAFAHEFFDETPRARLDAMLSEIRGALGGCKERMAVSERPGALEGVVLVECEHGVLSLDVRLADVEHRPIGALKYEIVPGKRVDVDHARLAP